MEFINQLNELMDDWSILKLLAQDEEYAALNLEDYSREQLISLLYKAARRIRSLALKEVPWFPSDTQEQLDTISFRLNKNSTNSSMRPSSDMYSAGMRKIDEDVDGQTNNGETTPSEQTVAPAHPDGHVQEEHIPSEQEQEEQQTEGDHANNDKNSTGTDGQQTTGQPGAVSEKTDDQVEKEAIDQEEASEKEYRKDHHRSRRKRSGKKPGRQPGVTGKAGMSIPENIAPENVHELIVMPNECIGCPNYADCKKTAPRGSGHHVINVELVLHDTIIRTVEMNSCPHADETLPIPLVIDTRPKLELVEVTSADDENKKVEGQDAGTADIIPNKRGQSPESPCPAVSVENTAATTEPEQQVFVCPPEGKKLAGQYPITAQGTKQYGIQIMVVACLVFCVGFASYSRTQSIVGPLLGIPLSTGTIEKWVTLLATLIQPTLEAILQQLGYEKVVHVDETGVNVDGKLHWIHCISTQMYTFLSVQAKRGKEGTDAIGFLTAYVGTVVHDCWSTYWQYDNCDHSTCNEHLERELVGVAKFFHNASLWANDMLSLMQEMLRAKHEAMNQGKTVLDPQMFATFSDRFDQLIAKGKELHPYIIQNGKRGRPKKGRARALVDRMEEHKTEIFRFLTDFDVPYTNNIALCELYVIRTIQTRTLDFQRFVA